MGRLAYLHHRGAFSHLKGCGRKGEGLSSQTGLGRGPLTDRPEVLGGPTVFCLVGWNNAYKHRV